MSTGCPAKVYHTRRPHPWKYRVGPPCVVHFGGTPRTVRIALKVVTNPDGDGEFIYRTLIKEIFERKKEGENFSHFTHLANQRTLFCLID